MSYKNFLCWFDCTLMQWAMLTYTNDQDCTCWCDRPYNPVTSQPERVFPQLTNHTSHGNCPSDIFHPADYATGWSLSKWDLYYFMGCFFLLQQCGTTSLCQGCLNDRMKREFYCFNSLCVCCVADELGLRTGVMGYPWISRGLCVLIKLQNDYLTTRCSAGAQNCLNMIILLNKPLFQ